MKNVKLLLLSTFTKKEFNKMKNWIEMYLWAVDPKGALVEELCWLIGRLRTLVYAVVGVYPLYFVIVVFEVLLLLIKGCLRGGVKVYSWFDYPDWF